MEGSEKESGKGRNEEPFLGSQTKSNEVKRKGRKMKIKIMDESKGGWMEGKKGSNSKQYKQDKKTK